jgi:nicotinamide mononucleotide transporter
MFWVEVVALIFGVLCVLLTIARSIWCWPTGLVQVLLFIVIFYQNKLYSDLLLHVIYVGMQIYGWICWRAVPAGEPAGEIHIDRITARQAMFWILVTAGGTFALGYGMQRWTDASFPFGDAFTTVASLVAQFLLARKVWENWMFWIVVDLVAIGIYFQKGLLPTTLLYSLFLVLAVTGLVVWRRHWLAQVSARESFA